MPVSRRLLLAMALGAMSLGVHRSHASVTGMSFASIDGGDIPLESLRGRPVLIVNTASRCGFTPQYDELQALYDHYKEDGLVVLAVPSNSFNQELETEAEVAEFCELNYSLTLPMAEITAVTGPNAHPFYNWLAVEHGVRPRWNFTKVLLDGEGRYVTHFGSTTRPMAPVVTRQIDALLSQ